MGLCLCDPRRSKKLELPTHCCLSGTNIHSQRLLKVKPWMCLYTGINILYFATPGCFFIIATPESVHGIGRT